MQTSSHEPRSMLGTLLRYVPARLRTYVSQYVCKYVPEVVPAVIPESLAHLRASVDAIAGTAGAVQIDIVDGTFAAPASWPYRTGIDELAACARDGGLSALAPLRVELDLMIEATPETVAPWLALGAARVVLHLESSTDIAPVIARARASGASVGLAITNDTPLSALAPHIASVDFIQCMGIATIGSQGQPFDARVLARVRELRAQYPGVPVGVDGGVNSETIGALAAAGASRLVAGSAIFGADDPRAAYRELLAHAHGAAGAS